MKIPFTRRKITVETRSPRSVPTSLQEVVQIGTPRAMALWLASTYNDERDTQLGQLNREQSLSLTDLLTPESAEELLESVSPHTAFAFLKFLPVQMAAGLLESLDSDEAARIVDLMNEDERQQILRAMENSHSALVRGLLAWPEDSAASRMRPDFLHVGPEATIQDAVDAARGDPDDLAEGVFVTTDGKAGQIVHGWLSPSALVLGRRAHPVTTQMTPVSRLEQWAIKPLDDQEKVSFRARERDADVIPVMDGKYLLGVISSDTVADILQEEATEDAERQGGSAPLDLPYLQASPILLWSKRVVWLLVLFAGAMYTGNVMQAFQDELEAVVALSFFVPLLIGTGGNVATQITTTLIRAMGMGEVHLRDLGRVIWKESRTGLLTAITMATAGAIRAWTLGVAGEVVLTVVLALAAIVLWSALIASILPLLLRRLGVDPAVVSGPMISTIVDGTGLLIYFTVAQMVISGL
ncbi:magnesium transporter [Actinomyces sp. F1_1611]